MAVTTGAASAQCAAGAPYDSLRFCQGQRVIPGIKNKSYYIAKRDIVKWPTLPDPSATGTTLKTAAVYAGDFTLAADKKWKCIDLALNKGNLEWETQGEHPSCTVLNKVTLSYPGTTAEAAAFCGMAMNDDLVYLVQQRDGQYRVLGNDMFNTVTKPKGSTGEGASTNGGTDLEIEVTDLYPAPFYGGKIETDDGIINETV